MSDALLAYVPVLHEGYRRFLSAHGEGLPLYLISPELHAEYRPLAKDIRALDPSLVARAIDAWEICSAVSVLDEQSAMALAAAQPSLVAPAEDVSYQVIERWFPRCEVRYDTTFLRWDKTRTAALHEPDAAVASEEDPALAELIGAAQREAEGGADWWRRVGAAIRFADGTVAATRNEHLPHPLSPYAVGDPRANFHKGVALELSTATHAEARLIAAAARDGRATEGAVMYVTDFPCPPCAKLIAGAGVACVYYRGGYAVLDGEDVLREAGVEIRLLS
ncbi:MAG TPA: deaminase [Solirubrobacteraceae bacterium]|jgi:dCMP deaminase|nr:deaminase [Solirubrobacteraceae bacterium]